MEAWAGGNEWAVLAGRRWVPVGARGSWVLHLPGGDGARRGERWEEALSTLQGFPVASF